MLKIEHACLKFGGLKAIDDVNIHIKPNKISALIGPNGAGKTTLFNIINGVYKPDSGSIIFDGGNIVGLKPFQVNAAGISRTYQVVNLFREMTVIENILVGMHAKLSAGLWSSVFRTKKFRQEEKEAFEKAYEHLEFVGLKDLATHKAGSLPYGKQRLLEISRGMASNPKLILLDEPAAGMNTKEKDELNQLIHEIIEENITVLVVEHDMKLIMGVADEVFVLNSGANLASGTPAEIQNNPDVIKAYLGGNE